jgi:small redox-active disulfide protein 2
MDIRVLGTGCSKCKTLEAMVREVVQELGVQADVSKVAEIDKIMEYDIMMTPGLVINGDVVAAGKLPTKDQIKQWIESGK